MNENPIPGPHQLPDVLTIPTAIMNIGCNSARGDEYKLGHRDARHAAADLVLERADELKALAQPAALAQLATMLAQYRNGERALPTYGELAALAGLAQGSPAAEQENVDAGRFDRVTPQADGSFQHYYRGMPVLGPVGGKEGGDT